MKRGFSFLILSIVIVLSSTAICYPFCYPSEGTMGTELIITGTNFGVKTGKVLIGNTDLKILEWNNENIHAVLVKLINPGIYDVIIQPHAPKGAPQIIEWQAFTIKGPEINSLSRTEGPAYDYVTIQGKFFGTKKGKVYMEGGEDGSLVKKNCKVVSWMMDSETAESEIVFVVPRLVSEIYDVVVDPYGTIPETEEDIFFALEAPKIISAVPNFGSVGDQITIYGRFFGIKKGKVYLSYEADGKKIKKICSVISWTVDSITKESKILFTVPRGLPPGEYDLIVTNSAGMDTYPDIFTIIIRKFSLQDLKRAAHNNQLIDTGNVFLKIEISTDKTGRQTIYLDLISELPIIGFNSCIFFDKNPLAQAEFAYKSDDLWYAMSAYNTAVAEEIAESIPLKKPFENIPYSWLLGAMLNNSQTNLGTIIITIEKKKKKNINNFWFIFEPYAL